jgi:hypothetical protein
VWAAAAEVSSQKNRKPSRIIETCLDKSTQKSAKVINYYPIMGVVPGGVGGAMASQDFGRSVNPYLNRGTDYAHVIAIGTSRFSDLPTALAIDT